MNLQQIKKLLRKTRPERIKVSDVIRNKIENIHYIKISDVISHLTNPIKLKHVETQPSRNPHDETYGLLFEITKRKRLFIVITYKSLENKIYIVTAFPTTKRIERIIKKPRIRG